MRKKKRKSKRCSACTRVRLVKFFWKCRSNADGLQYICRDCCCLRQALAADKLNAYRRERRKSDGAAINAQQRRYWRERREKKKLHNAKYLDKNRAANREACRTKYAKNPEPYKRRAQEWRLNNPEAYSAIKHNYRAREKKAEGSHTGEEWKQKLAVWSRRCAYCRCGGRLTKHHVVPLSRGGSNWISNIVPACRSCNSSIGTKTVYPKGPKK